MTIVRKNKQKKSISPKAERTILIVFICLCAVICTLAIAAVGLGFGQELFNSSASGELKSGEADFSFMLKDDDASILDLRTVKINITDDFDLSADVGEVKSAIEKAIDETNTLSVNAVIAEYDGDANYTVSDFDAFDYLLRYSAGRGLKVFIAVEVGEIFNSPAKADSAFLCSLRDKYGPYGIIISSVSAYYKDNIDTDKKTEAFISELVSVKRTLSENNYNFKLGMVFDSDGGNALMQKCIDNSAADMFFADIKNTLSSAENSAAAVIDSLGELALSHDARIYCILHDEKVMSGGDWNDSAEVYNQIRRVYNAGTLSGIVYNDIDSIISNRKGVTVSAYSYFKGFNDPDITSLSLTEFKLGENKDTLIIEGSVQKTENAVYIRNSADSSWVKITADKDGKFSTQINLLYGRNRIMLRHMNALYSYTFDRVQDLISNTAVENDTKRRTVTLSCDALAGSEVFAFINGEYVLLTAENSQSEGQTVRYSAVYKLGFKGEVGAVDVLFCGYLRGLHDEIKGGRQSEISPYSDNLLGRADMCLVTSDIAEGTPASENNDLSVPEVTPQINGSYGYADGIKLYENSVMYCVSSGIKVNARDAVYIIGAYKMPANTAAVVTSQSADVTSVTLKLDYGVFTTVSVAPQKYHEGYLGRKYNVDTCEGEYVDIKFHDVIGCSGICNFTNDTLFSSSEWIGGESSVTLRLHLKKKGGFYGYSVKNNADGTTVFEFKHARTDPNKLTVMLDPGHGGYGDTGTYSFGQSVYEQDITYAISLKIKSILEQSGYNVIITRKSDSGLTLSDRVAYARNVKPDIFVSVHCDGASDASAYGTHTFYYKNYSKALADSIHNNIVKSYRSVYYTDTTSPKYSGVDLGTRFFPYAVTRIEECPSVLVECGYLTNENDMKILSSENGQSTVAWAIAQGITEYFTQR